ncbi:class I SAM-dependent methyltransferase [Methylobacterium sp. WL9]|uniref:class I SAM-dependent methyltransferase n=1 Tax=Methylobacterium sp. WL9 TaxID=2603898 RepID=UPI0011CAE01D|nr:class I SAM-dependent methyltransferase [Methylobacterium sp. WL9]TXN22692.1 class I SAM-dependent methyltransferase [Methylobacterium sp. WL9]
MRIEIQIYLDEIRHQLQGWVGDRQPMIIDLIDEIQRDLGVVGDIAEIGVHHGLFLMLLAAVRQDHETIRAFDLFDRQDLNLDKSGQGSLEIFTAAIEKYYPGISESFIVKSEDSLNITPLNLKKYFPNNVRLFSIDGGHTRTHVINDLSVAQNVLSAGGVAILDDFFGPHWPEVTEGYFTFMNNNNRRLVPFLFFQNKLFLTTFSEHGNISNKFRALVEQRIGSEIHDGMWKYVNIAGHQVLSKA